MTIRFLCLFFYIKNNKGMVMANISDKDLDTFSHTFFSAGVCIMFDTTYYCDMMCPHCHYACDTKSRKFIPESEICAILDKLNEFNYKISDVHFSGGEITTIQEINPGYVRRVLSKSLEYNFYTTLLTNGSFIQKDYSDTIVKDLRDMYICSNDRFCVQMSFDRYHKNCVSNAHKLIDALDKQLQNAHGKKYPLSLTGFKHDPDFRNNLTTNPKHLDIHNSLSWDLNPLGRAKINNLPNCRDAKSEFIEFCGGDKLKQLIFTPLYPETDEKNFYGFHIMLVFNCHGDVVLSDAHNHENYDKFKTRYKNPDGTIKSLPEITTDLAVQLVNHFYGKEK